MSKKDKTKVKTQVSHLESDVHIEVPDDEIWTYKIEGLAAPHINKPFKNASAKKIVFVITIIIAISISMFFSIYSVVKSTGTEFEQNDTGYTIVRYSNKEKKSVDVIEVDYVFDIENGKQVKELDKPITEIKQFAFNESDCKVVKIGANVEYIDEKAFYSCWSLQRIEVEENNPNYSDIDGVLFNKDKTVLINYPCNHDQYLRVKYGYDIEESDKKDGDWDKYKEPHRWTTTEEYSAQLGRSDVTIEQYRKDIQTYVVPSSVEVISDLAFAYTNIQEIYLPEGLKRIETSGLFKLHEPASWGGNTPSLNNIYSYKSETAVTDTAFTSEEALGVVYKSLPEGLEYIGSDALSYNQEMQYLYIPASVKFIGHHAFWDTLYEDKDAGVLKGITEIFAALDEESFSKNVETGDQWRPQYDYLLFGKSVTVNYSAERAE